MGERIADTGVRILPCGDAALSVELGDAIDADINERVLALDRRLLAQPIPGVIETVPTYRALLVIYDPVAIGFAALADELRARLSHRVVERIPGRHWRVPVVYGGDSGIDLDAVARQTDLDTNEVIARHSAPRYRVYMLGFTPGFTYLGGLDPRLALPRRDEPRLATPAGTISIGGGQAAIQCLQGPSGWHLLGRTPVRTFHPQREPVFLIAPGDTVTFFPIAGRDWDALDRAAMAGESVAELVP